MAPWRIGRLFTYAAVGERGAGNGRVVGPRRQLLNVMGQMQERSVPPGPGLETG